MVQILGCDSKITGLRKAWLLSAAYCFICLHMFSLAVRQVQELHRKLSEESRRADNLAYEMKKLEEKHETVMKEKEVRQLWKCVRNNHQEGFIVFCCYELCGLNFYSRPLEDHHREGLSEGDQRGAAMHSGSAGPALTSRYLAAMLNLTGMTLLCPFFILKHTNFLYAGILPSSSPSHENLAAELIPIEYR